MFGLQTYNKLTVCQGLSVQSGMSCLLGVRKENGCKGSDAKKKQQKGFVKKKARTSEIETSQPYKKKTKRKRIYLVRRKKQT